MASTSSTPPSFRVDFFTGTNQNVIIILDCGGTISCPIVEASAGQAVTGLQPVENVIKTWIDHEPKVAQICGDYQLQVEHCFSEDSSDLQPSHWSTLAAQVNSHIKKPEVKGIIITHGTDTLAFTASALTFALPSLTKPIILTASQLPLLQPISDAPNNLLGSISAAASENLPPEVMVYFNYKLFLGHRIQKISATDIDAFDTPNAKILGRYVSKVELDQKISTKIWAQRIFFSKDLIQRFVQQMRFTITFRTPDSQDLVSVLAKPNETEVRRFLEDLDPARYLKACRYFAASIPLVPQSHDVRLLELFPGMPSPQSFSPKDGLQKGVVIRAFGTGNGPRHIQQWLDEETADILVAVCTSCLTGSVSTAYGASLKGERKNVALCNDMTIEACFCKMTYLPSYLTTIESKVDYMERSIRGELTKRK